MNDESIKMSISMLHNRLIVIDKEKQEAYDAIDRLRDSCPHNRIKKEDVTDFHICYSFRCECEVCGKVWYETENYSTFDIGRGKKR